VTKDPLPDQDKHKGIIKKGFRKISKRFLAYDFMAWPSTNRLPVVAEETGVVGGSNSQFHPCVSCFQ
jgi:hypothetical protein